MAAIAAATAILILAEASAQPFNPFEAERSAPAQNTQYLGRWQCQYVSRSSTGDRSVNYAYNFGLNLQADGRFEAQGSYYAETAGFNQPFQADGRWQTTQDGVAGTGQSYQPWNGPFVFQLVYYGPGNMTYRTQTHLGVIAIGCQR